MTAKHYVGLDVSARSVNLCVVDDEGRVAHERKLNVDPDAISAHLLGLDLHLFRDVRFVAPDVAPAGVVEDRPAVRIAQEARDPVVGLALRVGVEADAVLQAGRGGAEVAQDAGDRAGQTVADLGDHRVCSVRGKQSLAGR